MKTLMEVLFPETEEEIRRIEELRAKGLAASGYDEALDFSNDVAEETDDDHPTESSDEPSDRVEAPVLERFAADQKTLKNYRIKGQGEPCEPGETSARTGCVTKEGETKKKDSRPKAPRVKRGYRSVLPELKDKPPLKLLEEGDAEKLDRLRDAIDDMAEQNAWGDDGLAGWGRTTLNIDSLRAQFGEHGITDLIIKNWISKSQVYHEDGSRSDEYALTLAAKNAREAQLYNMAEINVPISKGGVADYGTMMRDHASTYLRQKMTEHVGLGHLWEAIRDREIDPRPLLQEMLYRRYNPVPIWDRIAKDRKLKDKVKQLASLWKNANADPALKDVSDQIQALSDQGDELFNEVVAINDKLYGPEARADTRDDSAWVAERQKLNARVEEIEKQTTEIGTKLTELYNQRMERRRPIEQRILNKILDVKKPVSVKADREQYNALPPAEQEGLFKAMDWLKGKVAKGPNGEELPQYTISRDDSDIIGRGGPSAYYRSTGHTINIPTGMTSTATNVHEMGHGIEYKMPGAQSAAQRFLEYRVKNEPLRKLKEVLPDSGYAAWEEGRSDDFGKAFGKSHAWYCGKSLSGGGGTEIISMGVEQLYSEPMTFAEKDPEFAAFVLGILDGSLRDKPVP